MQLACISGTQQKNLRAQVAFGGVGGDGFLGAGIADSSLHEILNVRVDVSTAFLHHSHDVLICDRAAHVLHSESSCFSTAS